MLRTVVAATALAVAGLLAPGLAQAQAPSVTTDTRSMVPGQAVALGAGLGDRTVSGVRVAPGGRALEVVYSQPGSPSDGRVVRLENVNGMFMVIYGGSVPAPTANSRVARLENVGGMFEVRYGAELPASPQQPVRRNARLVNNNGMFEVVYE